MPAANWPRFWMSRSIRGMSRERIGPCSGIRDSRPGRADDRSPPRRIHRVFRSCDYSKPWRAFPQPAALGGEPLAFAKRFHGGHDALLGAEHAAHRVFRSAAIRCTVLDVDHDRPIATGNRRPATTLVVKVGTHVLTRETDSSIRTGSPSLPARLHQVLPAGRKVVLVSSGAVGAGMGRLGLTQRPTDLAHLQAVAAIGQSLLVEAYERALRIRPPRRPGPADGRRPGTPHAAISTPEIRFSLCWNSAPSRSSTRTTRSPSRNCRPPLATTTGWPPS